MSQSIPISGLNELTQVSSSDYIPIVQNSSVTTFKTPLEVVATWISSSVEASSSVSSHSSSYALSASWANTASVAITANNLVYPNISTASFAIQALTASFALKVPVVPQVSASWASSSIFSISSSFASQSLSASWAPAVVSASWASSSNFSNSASFASQSISSSYAQVAATASYFPVTNFVKAFGTFYMTGSLGTPYNQANFIPYSGSVNFAVAAYQGYLYQNPGFGGMTTGSTKINPSTGFGQMHTWIFNMVNPMPTNNYTVICSNGGEEGSEWFTLTNFPNAARTPFAFSMSLNGGSANFDARPGPPTEFDWITIMVLHP